MCPEGWLLVLECVALQAVVVQARNSSQPESRLESVVLPV